METLNKVELRGFVGSCNTTTVGGTKTAQFSVATDYAYRDNSGCAIIETTWFNCRAFEGKDICNLDQLTRGAIVHLTGRLRCHRYQDAQGIDRAMYEVMVQKLEIIKED